MRYVMLGLLALVLTAAPVVADHDYWTRPVYVPTHTVSYGTTVYPDYDYYPTRSYYTNDYYYPSSRRIHYHDDGDNFRDAVIGIGLANEVFNEGRSRRTVREAAVGAFLLNEIAR